MRTGCDEAVIGRGYKEAVAAAATYVRYTLIHRHHLAYCFGVASQLLTPAGQRMRAVLIALRRRQFCPLETHEEWVE